MKNTTNNNNGLKAKFTKTINTICIVVLAFVFLTNYGSIKSYFTKKVSAPTTKAIPVTAINYNLDKEVLNAMQIAQEATYNYVSTELDIWINEMLSRVDEDFLDEYFSFMQVKKREILSVYNTIVHFFYKNAESAEEAAIRELEEEIARKVIKPEIAQMRISNITSNAINVYATTLDEQLIHVQETYNVPVVEWNKYISHICGLTLDIQNKSYPVTFKTLVVSGTALAGFVATPIIKNVATKVSAKIAEKTALKLGTKAIGTTAVKATSKAVGKGAGSVAKAIPYVGWGITAAICVWDIIDYANTTKEGKIQLKQNLTEYFQEVKTELLSSTDQSIMGSITHWENTVKAKIAE